MDDLSHVCKITEINYRYVSNSKQIIHKKCEVLQYCVIFSSLLVNFVATCALSKNGLCFISLMLLT
jgi:hypothetical protein